MLNCLVKTLLLVPRFQAMAVVGVKNEVCRTSTCYPVNRLSISDDKVSWNVSWSDYSPPEYSAPHLSTASWADADITNEKFTPKWNEDDGGIDRRSYSGAQTVEYAVKNRYPLNLRGRTGLSGRGRLGRWGPNHAGDAIVTRWKHLDGKKVTDSESGNPVLQFIAILRKDCGKWAIPGGFVDPKETSSSAVLRELFEEAINISRLPPHTQENLKDFFKNGKQVYRGYVDDPRNTDNAWIETTAINFHDDSGEHTADLSLDARDDAADVKWLDIEKSMDLYPPHYAIIECLKKLHSIAT